MYLVQKECIQNMIDFCSERIASEINQGAFLWNIILSEIIISLRNAS